MSKALAAVPKKRTRKKTSDITKTRRYRHNKAINQQALREKIEADGHYESIQAALAEFYSIVMEIKELEEMDQEQQARYTTQMIALKAILDAKFKLLNKFLPDLRSVELKPGDKENDPFAFAAKALAAALETDPD